MKLLFFHYVSVTLFPDSNTAFIHYHKAGIENNKRYEFETDRQVDFITGCKYLNRYNMKMEQDKNYKRMFRAVKG